MKFDWDEMKNAANIAKHGLSFRRAAMIFDGPVLSQIDDRRDYGETRVTSLGMVGDVAILLVVHTPREGVTRIISARPAKKKERMAYEAAIQARTDK